MLVWHSLRGAIFVAAFLGFNRFCSILRPFLYPGCISLLNRGWTECKVVDDLHTDAHHCTPLHTFNRIL